MREHRIIPTQQTDERYPRSSQQATTPSLSDELFEMLKKDVEDIRGRPLSPEEEHELRTGTNPADFITRDTVRQATYQERLTDEQKAAIANGADPLDLIRYYKNNMRTVPRTINQRPGKILPVPKPPARHAR